MRCLSSLRLLTWRSRLRALNGCALVQDMFGSDPILDEVTGPSSPSLGLPAAQSLA